MDANTKLKLQIYRKIKNAFPCFIRFRSSCSRKNQSVVACLSRSFACVRHKKAERDGGRILSHLFVVNKLQCKINRETFLLSVCVCVCVTNSRKGEA